MHITTRLFSIIVLLASPAYLMASDLEKEKRWADQIVDAIMVGEEAWLNDGKNDFLALYTENSAEQELGGAIIVHGIGVHPNWPDVVHPLRSQLPELGWHTLSIQMPILPNDAETADYAPLFPEVAPRLQAAVKFYEEKGIKNTVIVAHSLGASMSAYYLANNTSPVKALVAIGGTGTQFMVENLNILASIRKIKVPLLDIFGGEDSEDVMKSAKKKRDTAKDAGKTNFKQVILPGANHFHAGKEEQLVKTINEWLVQQVRSK